LAGGFHFLVYRSAGGFLLFIQDSMDGFCPEKIYKIYRMDAIGNNSAQGH